MMFYFRCTVYSYYPPLSFPSLPSCPASAHLSSSFLPSLSTEWTVFDVFSSMPAAAPSDMSNAAMPPSPSGPSRQTERRTTRMSHAENDLWKHRQTTGDETKENCTHTESWKKRRANRQANRGTRNEIILTQRMIDGNWHKDRQTTADDTRENYRHAELIDGNRGKKSAKQLHLSSPLTHPPR